MSTTELYNKKNKLILGDCLEVMKKMDSESIDLIYLDPPFYSGKNYEIIWGDEEDVRSFEDRWAGGIEHYIKWLYERVEQMHRLLKPTGSIYLHCDWHADAYIRVHILERIFGRNNFLSAIDWCYEDIGGKATKYFKRKKDTIYFYQKTNNKERVFNQQLKELSESTMKRYGKYFDENGHITYQKLKNVSPGAFAKLKGHPTNLSEVWLDKNKGQPIGDWWTDLSAIRKGFSEAIGYPTQKPLALLDRIIKASSNEGDVVLDPFMGGGTTMVVASRLGRQYIGIDKSIAAVDVTDKRLQTDGMFESHEIEKYYYAEEDLRDMDPFKFENLMITNFGGKPNTKQVGDHGIDGFKDGVPIQVKRWKNKIGRREIQLFSGACQANRLYSERIKEKLPVGYFIAFEFAKEAVEEMARLERENGIIIEKILVSEIVNVARKPVVRIEWAKTEDGKYKFEAISDSVILNYSWDFNYGVPSHKHPDETAKFNPSVLYDKIGVRVHNFSTSGSHNIAVKVVDDKCLENIAVCSITI